MGNRGSSDEQNMSGSGGGDDVPGSGSKTVTGSERLELGMIVCSICGELLGTLPSDGVKMFYSFCSKQDLVHRKCQQAENND